MIGILVTARLGSVRLARKHLLLADGRPLLEYLLLRMRHEFQNDIGDGRAQLVIATADEPENREFERFAPLGVSVFYGSPQNIPLRHLQAARRLGLAAIVSLDGDDILCSTRAARCVFQRLQENVAYVKTSKLPLGMNVLGYRAAFLESALAAYERETIVETGWPRIFDSSGCVICEFPSTCDPGLRLTLDYPQDFDFFTAVIHALGENVVSATDEDIIHTVTQNGLSSLNASVAEEYQSNFQRCLQAEAAIVAPLGAGEICEQQGKRD